MLFLMSKARIKIHSDMCIDEEVLIIDEVLKTIKSENDIYVDLNEIDKEYQYFTNNNRKNY